MVGRADAFGMADTLGRSDVRTADGQVVGSKTPGSQTALLGTDAASARAESRAVLRPIEAGSYVDCVACGERVKFQAKIRLLQVICNVYQDGRWLRVEHYHEACYLEVELPHGQPA